jgi:phage shock protein PspC (stress-responsive transcriptional regulator)
MNLADELKKLDNLHLSGALTEDEFRQAKHQLLYLNPPQPVRAQPEQMPSPTGFSLRNLTRSNLDSWFGGVCGGLGERGPLPAWAWRCLFAMAFLAWGIGLIPYALLWIMMPRETAVERVES